MTLLVTIDLIQLLINEHRDPNCSNDIQLFTGHFENFRVNEFPNLHLQVLGAM